MKKKVDNLDYIERKNFCLPKGEPQNWRKYLQLISVTKEL